MNKNIRLNNKTLTLEVQPVFKNRVYFTKIYQDIKRDNTRRRPIWTLDLG